MHKKSTEIASPEDGDSSLPLLKSGAIDSSSPLHPSRSSLSSHKSTTTSSCTVHHPKNSSDNANTGVSSGGTSKHSPSEDVLPSAAEEEPITGESLRVKRDWNSTMFTFLAGGVAGIASRSLTAPFDRVKIIVQEGYLTHLPEGQHAMATEKNTRLRDVAKMIYRDGGISGFWRGNLVNCCKASPEFALVFSLRHYFFSIYEDIVERDEKKAEKYSQFLQENGSHLASPSGTSPSAPSSSFVSRIPRLGVNCMIGAAAGLGAQSLLYPLEVVKTRVCVSRDAEFRSGGVRTIVREAYRHGGIKEFYKGFTPNMVGIVFYRGLELGIYSSIQQSLMLYRMKCHHCSRHDSALTVSEVGIAGMIASATAQTVTYPLNVIRTRLQTQGTQGRTKRYNGTIDCFVKVVKQKGFSALFSGLSANYLKAVPASSCAFVVFEKMQSFLLGDY